MKSTAEASALVNSVAAWHHRYEIAPGVITPGRYNPEFLLTKMELPSDLSGQRVLDLGCSDGFFSLHLRRRGAAVTAIDYRPKQMNGFGVMEQISGLDFEYRQANIYDLKPNELGTFDIVIFFGLLYHLPDMMRALLFIRQLSPKQLFLETHCAVDFSPQFAAARYYRGSSLNNDLTNFWSPNPQCLRDMLYDAGFDVAREDTWGDRYFAECHLNSEDRRLSKLRLAHGLIKGG